MPPVTTNSLIVGLYRTPFAQAGGALLLQCSTLRPSKQGTETGHIKAQLFDKAQIIGDCSYAQQGTSTEHKIGQRTGHNSAQTAR